jgi:signal transduction histidine kinase/ligand-binding sensor domain-containing protein
MLRYILFFGLIFGFILSEGQGFQQTVVIDTYSVEEGLSQSSVQDISQDIFGYIWVSTGDGLNRFDGSFFERYYFRNFITGAEQNNSFRRVISDSIGNLWIGTDRGLLFLDRSRDSLLQPFPTIKDLTNSPCLPLFVSNDSISVLVAGFGIINAHITQKKFRRIPLQGIMTGLSLMIISNDEIWFGLYPSRLVKVTIDQKKMLSLKVHETDIPDSEMIIGILKLSSERYLLVSRRWLYLLSSAANLITEPVKKDILRYLPENIRFKAANWDHEGRIWLLSLTNSIYVINRDFTLHKTLNLNKSQSRGQEPLLNLTTLFPDQEGNMWLGSDGSGLGCFCNNKNKLGLVDEMISNTGKQINPFIRCFFEDQTGRIWIGTYNSGIAGWNRQLNRYDQILLESDNNYPSANDVFCLAPYAGDKILAGTTTGLFMVNLQTQQAQRIKEITAGGTILKITDIVSLGQDVFSILLNNRIFRVENKNNSWRMHPSEFPDSLIYDKIAMNREGYLYAFTRKGFFNNVNGSAEYFNYQNDGRNVSFKVNGFYEDEQHHIWLATNFGLIKMDNFGRIIKIYAEAEGLPNHYIYGILSDDRSNLWLSSNRGLTRLNKESGNVTNFGIEDGLQSLEFNSGAYYRSRDGEMFFGGINGFNYFFADSLEKPDEHKKVLIGSVLVNDRPFLTDSSIMAKRSLVLSYSQNTITFDYLSINFRGSGRTGFEYFLQGHDPGWIRAGLNTRVRYSNLNPGNYIFRVRALDGDNDPKNSEARIHIRIKKAFWMTHGFIVGTILFSFLLIVVTVRYFATARIKKRIAQLERQQEISNIRRRIASDLHDDVGSGLSKLAMMSDQARRMDKPELEKGKYLQKISTDARQMIDQLRVIVWALNPQDDQLDSLISYIHQKMHDFLEEYPVNYKIAIPETIPEKTVSPEVKRNTYYAVREVINNATKHAEANQIEIVIEVLPDILQIDISDNGKGFMVIDQGRAGNGIRFMEKRIADLGGKLKIDSRQGTGTTVKMEIPV